MTQRLAGLTEAQIRINANHIASMSGDTTATGHMYREELAQLRNWARVGHPTAEDTYEELMDYPVRIGPHTVYGTFYTSGSSI